MDVPEMLERVARAIATSDGEDYMEDYRRYDLRARAAIEAMMEPTLAMKNAGWQEAVAQGHDATEIEVTPLYRAMLSASLKEQERT